MTANEMFDLAMKYIYGNGVCEDNVRAFELLSAAAELGHIEAVYNLGICYHYGYGVPANLKAAFESYLIAANARYGKGMEVVGRFYNRGIYVPMDRDKAEYWLKSAIDSGDPEAESKAQKELRINGRS